MVPIISALAQLSLGPLACRHTTSWQRHDHASLVPKMAAIRRSRRAVTLPCRAAIDAHQPPVALPPQPVPLSVRLDQRATLQAAPAMLPAPALQDIAEVPTAEACEEENGGLLWPFPLPSSHSATGNLWLMLSYGYVLFSAAGLISQGSELLLEILNPGIVGGLLLPTLGALPDSLIIIASGMRGTVAEAQKEVSVGLGVLAGSTVVLLTLAWAASLAGGRCDINEANGKAIDRTLTRGWDLNETGVTTDNQTRLGARIMMLSCLPYLVVQIPLIDGHPAEGPEAAVIGAGICGFGFVAYSIYQVTSPWLQQKRMREARKRLLRARVLSKVSKSTLSLGGLIAPTGKINEPAAADIFTSLDENSNGSLDTKELATFLRGVSLEAKGDVPTKEDVELWMEDFDFNKSGNVSLEEFKKGLSNWAVKLKKSQKAAVSADLMYSQATLQAEVLRAQERLLLLTTEDEDEDEAGLEDEEDEEEEEEELTAGQIAREAGIKMALGSALVATFADPTVGAIGNFSEAIQVDPFIVAFVVTPLASNASEVVSSFLFALKKRKTNISLCYSQVYGAITMNNTVCLGIFLAIVHLRGLVWNFSAEVTTMVTVILLMGAVGSSRNTFPLYYAIPSALLYPLSIAGVKYLEGSLGWQ